MTTEPKLAAPGAGLPLPELLIARWRFAKMRKKSSRDQVEALFESEKAKILELVQSCDPVLAGRRVLIKRLRGLEDSSRFWSVLMVLDHLRIVNESVRGTAMLLGRGTSPSGTVSTADVKPDPAVGLEVIDAFASSCQKLVETFGRIADLGTGVRHAHPWFGPLDASGWHALAAFHMRLHRSQIETVLGAVSSGDS